MDDRTEGLTDEVGIGRREAADAPDARTREIRAEIEHTREEMSETIEAIQEKLRPGNIVAGATGRVREATSEKVKKMANTASETASEVVEAGRQNWIPAALIGVGTAWLLMNRSESRGRVSGRGWSSGGRLGEYNTTDEYYRAVGTGGAAAVATSEYEASRAGEDVSGLAGRVTERASELADDTRQALKQTTRSVQQTTRRAQNELQRMINENPLMVGAAAVVLGAAVGMALPETEKENEWLGETRENVVDRGKEMARDAADRVKGAANDAVKTVTGSND